MYSLNLPVSAIRTKIRQEFEKHRYVSQLNVVDVLLFQSHAEFQVSPHIYTHAVEPVRAMHQQVRGYTHAIQIDPILPHHRHATPANTIHHRKPSTTGNSSPM